VIQEVTAHIHRLIRRGFTYLAALVLWLSGYTRYDILYILKADLDKVKECNIIIDDFAEYVKICNEKFQRYNKEDIERLVRTYLDTKELIGLILANANIGELKILAYTSDYVIRTGRFSVYGVSDYIRCTEVLENVNVEHHVITTLQKYLVYMCDKLYTCVEYSWTNELIQKLHSILADKFKLPSDDDIVKEVELVLEKPCGLKIIAAMYSMSTGSIDQFQLFHRRRVQDFLKDIKYIRYVYFNGFLNALAIPHIETAVRKRIIDAIVDKICDVLNTDIERVDVSSVYITYELRNGVCVRVPKMYYFSPIFWAKSNVINIVYELPYSVRDYVLTYSPYFENSILILCRGSDIVSIYVFNNFDKHVCERLSKVKNLVIVHGYRSRY